MKACFIAFMFFFVVFANANDLLEVSKQCNGALTGTINRPEIPPASCSVTAKKIAPGFNVSLQGEGPSMFFFDVYVDVNLNNKNIPIRFIVFEDEKDYNAIQAIVQTAYAMRSLVSIILPNPTVSMKLYDLSVFNVKRKTEKACYKSVALDGSIVAINCSIQSIQLSAN